MSVPAPSPASHLHEPPYPRPDGLLECPACRSLLCASGVDEATRSHHEALAPVHLSPCAHVVCDVCSNVKTAEGVCVCRQAEQARRRTSVLGVGARVGHSSSSGRVQGLTQLV